MELTRKQQEGLRIAVARYKAGEPYTCISGYAGSGKSTLVRFIIDALEIPEQYVAYVTYTGKAASVLAHKGCPNAKTAHKLLYQARLTKTGNYIFIPRDMLEEPYKVIVVDEVSMLPQNMWDLLLRHGVYVIACGDPEQLPPISKDTANTILDHPHVFLDEIMRQALESDIIRLSMDIREGKTIKPYLGNDARVYKANDPAITEGLYLWADQILTATHKKRIEINNCIRSLNNMGDVPQIGDRIICNKNNWEIISDLDNPIVNGTIGTITKMELIPDKIIYQTYKNLIKLDTLIVDLETAEGDHYYNLPIDYNAILTNEPTLTNEERYILSKAKVQAPIDFHYGYAITTHRAQGSQWDKVLVFEEGFPFNREEHRRWLYTACTRAAEKLVLVQK